MQLPIVIAVLAAFVAAQNGGDVAPLAPWRLAIACLAGLVGPIAAWLGCLRLTARVWQSRGLWEPAAGRNELRKRPDLAARCDWLEKWVWALWLVGIVAMLSLGQWVGLVQALGNISAFPLGAELAALAPVIGSLWAIWAAFYWLEARLRGADRREGLWAASSGLMRFLWLQTRQQLALLVVPPLALGGLVELAARAGMGGEAPLGSAGGTAGGWWALGMPLGLALVMPLAVRRLWKTSPLPEGPLRQELLAHCQARRCPVHQVLLWHTGMRQANAAVVGLLPRLRYVLISDRLLAMLTRSELMAVLRHELAHLKRGHLILRLAVLALPVASWMALGPSGSSEAIPLASAEASAVAPLALEAKVPLEAKVDGGLKASLTAAPWASLVFPVAMLAYGVLVVGGYSRWLEHEADLEACLDDQGRFDPWAAEDLADALRVVVGREEGGWLMAWLHPPLAARLAFLHRAQHDAAFVSSFRWRLRGAATVLVVLWLAVGWAVLLGR